MSLLSHDIYFICYCSVLSNELLLNFIGAKLNLVAEGKSLLIFAECFQVIFNRLACYFKANTFQSFFLLSTTKKLLFCCRTILCLITIIIILLKNTVLFTIVLFIFCSVFLTPTSSHEVKHIQQQDVYLQRQSLTELPAPALGVDKFHQQQSARVLCLLSCHLLYIL